MSWIESAQAAVHNLDLPSLLVVGVITALGLYFGKAVRHIRLPSIIGFMIIGVLLGPSLVNLIDDGLRENLSFVTEIALGFVAISIGLELSFGVLRRQGWGIILIILSESFLAFFVVTGGIYLLTGDLPLALIFGAVAPASAPAGTVAVIRENSARGPLTQSLYAVVGFDDGLGIVIFGFASAVARSILLRESGGISEGFWRTMGPPLEEIALSLGLGALLGVVFSVLARRFESSRDIYILTFATVLIAIGLSLRLHLSLILTNMVLGLVIVNTQPRSFVEKTRAILTEVMPLLFVLFFVLAGVNLHVSALPALGLVGLVYILSRSAGLMGGAWLGAVLSRAEAKIRKYLGMGILSQAGVAIGLALIVKQEFTSISDWGARIGSTILATVTATSIVFEIVGPILTKIGLKKAGEIRMGVGED